MERLTIATEDMWAIKGKIDEAVFRLAAIEDILGDDYNLDRLKVIVNQHMTMREEVAERFRITKDVPVERLKELVSADKDGRCFVSDIKLGVEVFYIPKFNGKPYCGIKTGHIQAVAFTKAGKRVKIREHHAHNQDFMIGKTVFLAPEAAEAAMKGEG